MRRSIEKHIRVTPEENEEWRRKAELTCMTESALVRTLMKGYHPKEKPDMYFYDALRQLSYIGNNLNQLLKKANTLNFIDAPMLRKEIEAWQKFRSDIERRFLLPEKSDVKWQ